MTTKKLSSKDYEIIRGIVEDVLEEKLEEKLKYLPTKKDFDQKMDKLYMQNEKIIKELEDMRANNIISNHQSIGHESRIEALEAIHPQGQHAVK